MYLQAKDMEILKSSQLLRICRVLYYDITAIFRVSPVSFFHKPIPVSVHVNCVTNLLIREASEI